MGATHRLNAMTESRSAIRLCHQLLLAILVLISSRAASAQELILQVDPPQTSIKFTLGAALHSVHGTFEAKAITLRANLASGTLSGQISVDAKTGQTGNGMRDRKMHKEVLESQMYPDITFRPDRVYGATNGRPSVMVHGVFAIHGSEHEITVPADVDLSVDHWSAKAHFTIPYVKWGMKNPSTLFLHVSDEVEVDVALAGTLTRDTSTAHPNQ